MICIYNLATTKIMVMNLHSLFLSICACSGLESTTAFGGDCLEVIEFVKAVLDASSTLNSGWPDGAVELPRLSPVKNIYLSIIAVNLRAIQT